jgi:hypothetical protein
MAPRFLASVGDRLKDKTFPDICTATQETVDAIYHIYSAVRLLIGGLSADPPSKTTETVGKDTDGSIRGYIGTTIPGTRKINLDPLFDRQRRLEVIEAHRARLLDRIDVLLPPLSNGKFRRV